MNSRTFLVALAPFLAIAASACGDDESPSAAAGGMAGTGGASGNGGSGGDSGGTSGNGGAFTVPAPPSLVERTPDVDVGNVWYYDPIVLVFSEALDPASVGPTSVTVEVGGMAVAGTPELSADGTTITFEPSAAPPNLPASATIAVSNTILDLDGLPFAGDTWEYALPLWQTPGAALSSADAGSPRIAVVDDQPVVAWTEGGVVLRVGVWDGAAWQQLGGALTTDSAVLSTAPALVADSQGSSVVAWGQTGSPAGVVAKRWDQDAWVDVGAAIAASDPVTVELAVDAAGVAHVGYVDGDVLHVASSASGSWTDIGQIAGVSSADFALLVDDDGPLVAYYMAGAGNAGSIDLSVARLSGSTATPLGTAISVSSTWATRPTLAQAAGVFYVGFTNGDGISANGYVYRSPATSTGTWQTLGPALDLVLDAQVSGVTVGTSADGSISAAWTEQFGTQSRILASRSSGGSFEILSQSLSNSASGVANQASLALDSRGNPHVASAESASIRVKRYNGSPELPFGLTTRASTAGCVIPDDADVNFPQNLAGTGCYTNVRNRVLIPGAIPFELNTALWSDGAHKRRYLVIPDGQTIGITETGAWQMPVGTIIVKEFLIPANSANPAALTAMETRFLVKRCEDVGSACPQPLQGYSYKWNAEGTEAALMTNATVETAFWPVTVAGIAGMHEHTYPSRTDCLTCHNVAAGRVLGVQTVQFNRDQDFGGVIDNQIRAMANIGMFGNAVPAAPARLPMSNDVGESLERRNRGYFHANCSHCHRAGGVQLTIDFRFDIPMSATNICNKIVLDPLNPPPLPWDPLQALIYQRDSSRLANQMPPLATLITDDRQLAVTAAWIAGMTSCP